MTKTKREFLAMIGAASAVPAAGCSGGGNSTPNEETTTDPTESLTPTEEEENSPTPTASATEIPTETVIVDDTLNLQEPDSASYQFTVQSKNILSYDFEVDDDIEIDIYLLSLSEYDNYQSGRLFNPIESIEGVADETGEFQINRGAYRFVIDHTRKGATEPPDPIDQVPAVVTIRATYRPRSSS